MSFATDGSWLIVPDLHGDLSRWQAAQRLMDEYPAARVAFLGDLIDDSPRRREARKVKVAPGTPDDSRTILWEVRALVEGDRAEVLLGNHEIMALGTLDGDRAMMNLWWKHGGREAAASYGWDGKEPVPATLSADLDWLAERAWLWFSIDLSDSRLLLAHATRPGLDQVAHTPRAVLRITACEENHLTCLHSTSYSLFCTRFARQKDVPSFCQML